MSSQQVLEKKDPRKKKKEKRSFWYRDFMGRKRIRLPLSSLRELPDLLRDFKNSFFIIILWMIISEIAGYPVLDTLKSIIKLIIYPINWILFRTGFRLTGIPEIFILFVPLMLVVSIGFLILISTED